MRLQIRRHDGGPAGGFYITDDTGNPLPGQVSVDFHHADPGELPTLSVTFQVDGVDVVTIENLAATPGGTLAEASAAFAALPEANRRRFLTMYGLAPVEGAASALPGVFFTTQHQARRMAAMAGRTYPHADMSAGAFDWNPVKPAEFGQGWVDVTDMTTQPGYVECYNAVSGSYRHARFGDDLWTIGRAPRIEDERLEPWQAGTCEVCGAGADELHTDACTEEGMAQDRAAPNPIEPTRRAGYRGRG